MYVCMYRCTQITSLHEGILSLYVCESIILSVCVCMSVCVSFCASVCPCIVCLIISSAYLPASLPVCLFADFSVCLSVSLSLCLLVLKFLFFTCLSVPIELDGQLIRSADDRNRDFSYNIHIHIPTSLYKIHNRHMHRLTHQLPRTHAHTHKHLNAKTHTGINTQAH